MIYQFNTLSLRNFQRQPLLLLLLSLTIDLLFWLAIKKCDPNPNQAKCSCHLGPDVGALMPVLNKMYPTNINVSILCCSC